MLTMNIRVLCAQPHFSRDCRAVWFPPHKTVLRLGKSDRGQKREKLVNALAAVLFLFLFLFPLSCLCMDTCLHVCGHVYVNGGVM